MAAKLRELAGELKLIRKRLERVAAVFIISFVALTALPITRSGLLQSPNALGWIGDSASVHVIVWIEGFLLPPGQRILVVGPFDAFSVIMEVGFYLSLLVTVPYAVAELMAYLRDGIYPHERKAIRRMSALALALFGGGALFGLFVVLPPLYVFAYQLQGTVNASGTVSLTGFVETTFFFVIGLGIAFEIPTLCLALSYVGMLSSQLLRQYWRYAVAGCFVVAFLISPGVGGGVIETFIAFVLSLLYGASYVLVRSVERRRARSAGQPANVIVQNGGI